jgi:peptidoglycan hydrolase CwlO-like protein
VETAARPAHPLSAGPIRRSLFVSGVAFAALCAAATTASAAPSAVDVQREGVRALEVELGGLDAQARQSLAAAQEAAGRLAAARERLRENAAALRRAAADHRAAQRLLAGRLVAIYRQDQPDFVQILLTSGGISEAFDGVQSLERIGRQDANIIQTLRTTQARMREARVALVEQRQTARTDLVVAMARRRRTEAVVAQRRTVLVDARQRLSVMIAQEAARQQAAAQVQARLAALRSAQAGLTARLAAPSATPAPVAEPSGGMPSAATLAKIAQCESGGNRAAVSSSGLYRGKYQFDPQTWRSVGGTGDPAAAPVAEQDRRAALLYAQRGSSPWPVCGR